MTADAPTVSILMASYNGARFLQAAIDSVLAQTHTAWELLIVDDASSDDSATLADHAALLDSRIQVFRHPTRGGPGAARNRALDAARGDWVAVMDADDLISPDRLERLLARAGADAARIVADNQELFWEDPPKRSLYLTAEALPAPAWIDLRDFIACEAGGVKLPPLGYLKPLINRALIEAIGLRYDPRLPIGEDYDFLARLLAGGERLRLDPAAMYRYRRHAGSISHRAPQQALTALLAADDRFRADHAQLSAPVVRALTARRASLATLLAWERFAAHLKRREVGAALAVLAGRPALMSKFAEPLAARLSRLRARA